ncbi:LON peptidase substrate-binding domain-containing protein [Paraferrimonas haliotis]|uniref:Peptidase S16 n=1 Tax=Paraferrimonas haliotis TaxID=2013866 RepID=A0AA37TQ41_9GAMM|nr:LON peptidase substrate-binding domain-containing protein [Paraferrimonas haliotis]GLS82501.1 peptidase S16 [Paraferrimonas haliotis]
MKIAVFPLPILLLPGGISKLRIFESRYKRLVAEAHHCDNSFVLCPAINEGESTPFNIGTRVEIIDFDVLEDGLLGITIEAKERVSLFDFSQDDDGLHRAAYIAMAPYTTERSIDEFPLLVTSLKQVLPHDFDIDERKLEQNLCDLAWICQRWLECIPFENSSIKRILAEQKLDDLLEVLTQLVDEFVSKNA